MKRTSLLFSMLLAGVCTLLLTAAGRAPRTIQLRLERQNLTLESNRYGIHPLRADGRLVNVYPRTTGVPEGWQPVFITSELPRALYGAFRSGRIDEATCMGWFNAWGKDTAEVAGPSARLFLAFALGRDSTGAERMMFDTDGDYDFSDEADYPAIPGGFRVKMAYERVVDGKVIPDFTWVEPIEPYGGMPAVCLREMTQGEFRIGDIDYTCSVISGDNTYEKDNCEIRISTGGLNATYEVGDCARLLGAIYRIDSLASDGRFIRLTEVANVENLESTQVGFKPFSFTTTDLEGREMRFPEDFAGKYVLLDFWSTGCGPCVQEIRNDYPDIYARFKESGFEILGVADNTASDLRQFMEKTPMPWIVVADRDNGRALQKMYAIQSYPNLFLIGPDGRIVAKGMDLRGDHLEQALRRYLPGVPKMQ